MQDSQNKITKIDNKQQKIIILVVGYCHEIQKNNLNTFIPVDIIQLVVKFFNPMKSKVYYQMQRYFSSKFDLYFKDLTKNDISFLQVKEQLNQQYRINISKIENPLVINKRKFLFLSVENQKKPLFFDNSHEEKYGFQAIKKLLEQNYIFQEIPEGYVNGNALEYIKKEELKMTNNNITNEVASEETVGYQIERKSMT